jgi:hypothetical protein
MPKGDEMKSTSLEALRKLAAMAPQPSEQKVPNGASNNNGNSGAYGKKALEDEISILRAAEPGDRNNQLFRSAAKLFSLAAGGELDEHEVETELERAALDTGLDLPEIKSTIRSAHDRGMKNPRTRRVRPSAPKVSSNAYGNRKGGEAEAVTTPQARSAENEREPQETIEILDTAPASITKTLTLIGDHAYAATSVYTRRAKRQAKSKATGNDTTPTKDGQGDHQASGAEEPGGQSEAVKQDVRTTIEEEVRLVIVRDDGVVYGIDKPLTKMGVHIHLPEQPPHDKLWSGPGVKAYKAGTCPSPANVFERIVQVVGKFIDFEKSLADQPTMCQFIACYILTTWFLDAFNVAGFLWPNGEKGSGKTQLITLIAELSYLGQVILAGGSYAALRDLADNGAFLAFDDAENIANPKTTDPDKRALLLAGNRRGNTVPVKEPTGTRGWQTRYVNTFCPRAFTAIRLPDPVLASRTIVVPLIRTPNRERANADPLDFKLWPHDRRQLMDDLWALALAHLPELPAFDDFVSQNARLIGRNLEPWRAVLAVAAWLDKNGVPGLWEKIEALSVAYQSERPNVETSDLTVLVIRALLEIVAHTRGLSDISDVSDISDIQSLTAPITAKTSEIRDTAHNIVRQDEMDIDTEHITSRSIGRIMGRLRFTEDREKGTGRRGWAFTPAEVASWWERYGLGLHIEPLDP